MPTLYIETSTTVAALAFDRTVLLDGGPMLSKHLSHAAQTLLEERLPEAIAVGTGPGSFTGIRVGAALATGLALGWGIPLFGFCSMRAFAPKTKEPWAVLFDARTPGLYILTSEWEAPRLVPHSEAPSLLERFPLLVSPHPEKLSLKRAIQPAIPSVEAMAQGASRAPLRFQYLDGKAHLPIK